MADNEEGLCERITEWKFGMEIKDLKVNPAKKKLM